MAEAPVKATEASSPEGSYVVPLIHTRVPSRVVDAGFWAALAGTALAGAVDPPLALLVGAGVVVARHRRR